ncbi:SusC/RagA family TonB-linked outer membrane protein [Sphingobacterium ginsenosidimutans]|uniref:SusC/RagA family TonB-linked outer membrane protein n=1 Tax=Sphingobacterium ginsenosidimutans TaxID=687845 RepID=A0ABP8A8S5_9SPHI
MNKLRLKLILLGFGISAFQFVQAQQKSLTLSVSNKSMQTILDEIEKKSGFRFFYNNNQIDTKRSFSVNAKGEDINAVLERLFKGTEISYRIMEGNIILSVKEKSSVTKSEGQQQLITVSGIVLDESQKPFSGATVSQGERKTSTDQLGKFTIRVQADQNLFVNALGFESVELSPSSSHELRVQLNTGNRALDEVVVTALGVKREQKALGYAVQKVGGAALSSAKGVDVATSLTGRVAGLNIKNSTEFNTTPTIELRGRTPLIVIDGVASQFVSLRDVPADDIEDISVLKGATAAALYGSRGGAGAIMITTKKSKGKGLDVQLNSSTMFNAGYLRRPEVQTSYSTGQGGKYKPGSYVWGDKLDIGRTAKIYNPYTFQEEDTELRSVGKDNLKNFQQQSFITNNNISIAQRGENGGVRASFTHVYNKGQYENNKLNKMTYSVSGDMTAGKFKFEGGLNYNKRYYPNMGATGYGGGGILYNLTVWSGTEYDIRDYKNYWVTPNEKQNWMDASWYDNPYFIANEIVHSGDYNILNGYLNTEFKSNDWLTITARLGSDVYSQLDQYQNPIGAVGGWHRLGYFSTSREGGYSVNGDLMATAKKQFGQFNVEGFVGTGINYRNKDNQNGSTSGGLTIPGFYSLKASVNPATTTSQLERRQENAIYGRFTASWKNAVFLEVTGRNDWSSTLDKNNRSFFYPSVLSSVVLSDLLNLPSAISFWKVRGSWTRTKTAPDIYAINQQYTINSDVWQGLGTASYPSTLRNASIKPVTMDSWELGTGINLLKNRIQFDLTYYDALTFNQQRDAAISSASGFSRTQINIKEDLRRRGVEIMLGADVIKSADFNWNSKINWSRERYTYDRVDPDYSTDRPWVKDGARWNWVAINDWERDPSGNIIHYGGLPRASAYQTVAGFNEADFIWGWSNTFSYKQFTLNLSFDGRVGGIAQSVTDQAMWNSGSHPDSDNEYRYDMVVNGKNNYVGQGVKVLSGSVDYDSYGNITRDDRVFTANDVPVSYENYQIRMAPYIGSPRSQFMFSQTFVKLRDLSLEYRLPVAWSQKIKAKNTSVGLIGQNLWMWAKDFKYSDPDIGKENLNSASIRYIGMNVKLQF